MAQQFTSYLSLLRSLDPEAALSLETDWNLFAASAGPNIRLGLDGLPRLRASEFLDPDGIQWGDNITTRAEVTRVTLVRRQYALSTLQRTNIYIRCGQ